MPKFAVDILIRVQVEADNQKDAELAACLPSIDWNQACLLDLDAMPGEWVIECKECGGTVPVREHGFDETIHHEVGCSKLPATV